MALKPLNSCSLEQLALKELICKCRMEPSAGDDESDDAEVFSSHQPTPTDVLSSPTGYSVARQQYDCHAGASSSSAVPAWSESLPIPVLPVSQPTGPHVHDGSVDFLSVVHQRKKTVLHANFQTQVYNFLERPTGWKCFLYHFSVYVFFRCLSFICFEL